MINSNNLYNNGSKIGIGTANPLAKFHIADNLSGNSFAAMKVDAEGGNLPDSIYRGVFSTITGTNGFTRGIAGFAKGSNSRANIGVFGAGQESIENRGTYGRAALENNNPEGFNYGLTGVASNSIFSNIAVGAYADNGNSQSGDNFGVSARASSITPGINYGIYSEASNASTNYAGFFNGNVSVTGTFSNPSDKKLKSNIQSLNNSMKLIRQLRPVEYEYKKELKEKGLNLPQNRQFGFIAQELQTILPELVSKHYLNLTSTGGGEMDLVSGENSKTKNTGENMEFIGVNYISLIPILVQGIKEQDSKITELENLIQTLQKEVAELKKK